MEPVSHLTVSIRLYVCLCAQVSNNQYSVWHKRLSCHSNTKHKRWIKVIIWSWQDIMLVWPTKGWQEEKHEADQRTQHPAICHRLQDDLNLLLTHPTDRKTFFFCLFCFIWGTSHFHFQWKRGKISWCITNNCKHNSQPNKSIRFNFMKIIIHYYYRIINTIIALLLLLSSLIFEYYH